MKSIALQKCKHRRVCKAITCQRGEVDIEFHTITYCKKCGKVLSSTLTPEVSFTIDGDVE